MRARVERAVRDEDSGMTIVELMVSMLITSMVLAMIAAMFINVAKITSVANATTQRSSIAGNTMDELVEVIRTATTNAVATSVDPDPALVSATTTALTLYSFVDAAPAAPAPTKVTFRFDSNGYLIEDRITGTDSNGYWAFSGAVDSRTLGGPMDLTGGDPFFTYLDSAGAVITPGSGLTLAQRKLVGSIRVSIRITNLPSAGNDPIIVINTIGMPNLKITRTDKP